MIELAFVIEIGIMAIFLLNENNEKIMAKKKAQDKKTK